MNTFVGMSFFMTDPIHSTTSDQSKSFPQ